MADTSAQEENVPPPNMASSSRVYENVVDGTQDVAVTASLEKMRVEAPGRKPLQYVYLWTTSEGDDDGENSSKKKKGRATNVQYDPQQHGPNATGRYPRLPGGPELFEAPHTMEYLEVGLVIGDEPDRYKPKGQSRDKARTTEREKRGVMPREPSAMRVFTPVFNTIQPQSKFYVGCGLNGGRLSPRVIEAALVFFYPEF